MHLPVVAMPKESLAHVESVRRVATRPVAAVIRMMWAAASEANEKVVDAQAVIVMIALPPAIAGNALPAGMRHRAPTDHPKSPRADPHRAGLQNVVIGARSQNPIGRTTVLGEKSKQSKCRLGSMPFRC